MTTIGTWSRIALLIGCTLAMAANGTSAQDTLFADLGGQDAITKIANDTTDNFLADDRIKASFADSDMDRFRRMLAEQFCQISGGPCVYTGHNMREAHKGLHLKNADFNAVVEDLQKALDKNSIPFATQNRLLARLAPMQHDIVTR